MVQSVHRGAMRIVIEVVKNIAFGEQILTYYGPNYLGDNDEGGVEVGVGVGVGGLGGCSRGGI